MTGKSLKKMMKPSSVGSWPKVQTPTSVQIRTRGRDLITRIQLIFTHLELCWRQQPVLQALQSLTSSWSTAPSSRTAGPYTKLFSGQTTTTDVIEMVEHLTKRGADVNQLAFSMTGLFWGGRPLTPAAGLGDMELIHWLLDRGADPTAGNRHGLPPCGFAKYYEHEEADKLLTDLYNKAVSEEKVNDSI